MKMKFKYTGIIAVSLLTILGTRCTHTSLPPEVSLPLQPTGLACVINGTDILLTWRDNAMNEIGYLVERSVGDAKHFVYTDTLAANAARFVDSGLAPGHYYYRIKAFNAAGISLPSNISDILITVLIPPIPGSFQITRRGFFSVALEWNDLDMNETGFAIERSRDDSLHFIQIVNLAANTSTYADSSLDPGVQYYYRIRSYNANGWSNYSGLISVITRISTLAFTPTSTNVFAWNQVTLTFDLIDPMFAIFGVSLRIAFDANILEFVAFSPGDFFGPEVIAFSQRKDNTIYVTLTRKQGMSPVSTTGMLGSLTFRAIGTGSGNVWIQQENLNFYNSLGNTFDLPSLQIQNAQITVR